MALSDLEVFSENLYRTITENVDFQVEKFNEASNGAIVLNRSAHMGDYNDKTLYAYLADIVRRRNPYGSGTVASKKLQHLLDTMVKVAGGTAPIEWTKTQYKWIQQDEAQHGIALGMQLSKQMMADMLKLAIISGIAAMSQVTANIHDGTTDVISHQAMLTAKSKFGDAYSSIVAWVMHSKPFFDLMGENLTNDSNLFKYGTINVMRDPMGVPYIITDQPNLIEEDGVTTDVDKYSSLGLVPGAFVVERNNDFDEAMETKTGDENIIRVYQAEWSNQLGVKGFAYDKANGGPAPDEAALGTASNWDRYATSTKDLPGVLLETR